MPARACVAAAAAQIPSDDDEARLAGSDLFAILQLGSGENTKVGSRGVRDTFAVTTDPI